MDENDPIDILARTAWGEARNQSDDGMQAVMNVVFNRVNSGIKWWGTDVISVCRAKEQFDCWLTNDPNYDKLINVGSDDPQFQIALSLASAAVGDGLDDLTNGATMYYSRFMSEPPYWAAGKTPCAVIRDHIFFEIK